MSNNIIQLDNLYFVRLTAETGFDTTQIMAHDGVLIDSNDSQFVQNCVLNIRRHHQPEVYLKPIFLCQYHPNKFIHLHALSDGHYINEGDAGLAIAKTKKIFQKTLQLHDSKPNSAFGSAIKKALDYMYCRENRTLQPVLDPFSIIGYSYPEMSVSFDIHEEAQLLDALDWAEENELLWPDFQEKIYVCNQCSGGFLSYREVCPHCQSSHTYGEDLVHHFPCAYIGPISDYKKDQHDGLHCPKCDKGVHHIGVDYDKPSVLYHCNTCDTKFQDLYVKAKCLCCQNDVEVQYLQSRKINTYKLTSKGRHVIANGFASSNEQMQTSAKDREFLSEETFVSLLGMDCTRAQLESKSIAILAIRLQQHQALEKQMGHYRFKKLILELYDILKNELTPLEYIFLDQGHTFYLTQYLDGEMDAQQILKAMTERLQELIKRNHEPLDSKMQTHHLLLKDFNNGRAIFTAAKQQLS